jgi:hypothetical protein
MVTQIKHAKGNGVNILQLWITNKWTSVLSCEAHHIGEVFIKALRRFLLSLIARYIPRPGGQCILMVTVEIFWLAKQLY